MVVQIEHNDCIDPVEISDALPSQLLVLLKKKVDMSVYTSKRKKKKKRRKNLRNQRRKDRGSPRETEDNRHR